MKKPLVVVGAVASAFALSAVPAIAPALGMAAYAVTGANNTASAITKIDQLRDEVKKEFPEVEKWADISSLLSIIDERYACGGKGCGVDAFTKVDENGEPVLDENGNVVRVYPVEILDDIVKSSGKDPATMTTLEKLDLIKSTQQYKDDAEVQKYVKAAEDDVISLLNAIMEGDLPVAVDKSKLQNLLPAELISALKATPNYDVMTALGNAYFYYVDESMELAQVDEIYDRLVAARDAARKQLSVSSSAEEVKTTTNELKALVEKTKANPEYQKYEKLVRGVHDAEVLLGTLNSSSNTDGKARTARNESSTTIMTLAVAREVAAEDDATTAEIVATIKALGDAMRTVGVKTTLGEGLTTATVEDLAKAIEAARGVEKFAQYEELVEAIDIAEAAIANGVTDAAVLKQVLANVQTIAKKVLPPDAGAAPIENTEVSAVASFSTSAIVATLATTAGAAVILKRRFANKN